VCGGPHELRAGGGQRAPRALGNLEADGSWNAHPHGAVRGRRASGAPQAAPAEPAPWSIRGQPSKV